MEVQLLTTLLQNTHDKIKILEKMLLVGTLSLVTDQGGKCIAGKMDRGAYTLVSCALRSSFELRFLVILDNMDTYLFK